jgi:hypothetical protein
MVRLNRVSNDFTKVAKDLQAWHRRHYFQTLPCSQVKAIKQLGTARYLYHYLCAKNTWYVELPQEGRALTQPDVVF